MKAIEENKITNAKAFILLDNNKLEEIASCCNLPLEKVQDLAVDVVK